MSHGHLSKNFFLQGLAGKLEAVLWTPHDDAVPRCAALICHPHPLFGGTLHNKVVYQAAKALDGLGIPVRYVGVGESVADLIPFDPDAFVAALFA